MTDSSTTVQDALVDEIIAAYLEKLAAGEQPDRHELVARFHVLGPELAAFFANHDDVTQLASSLRPVTLAARHVPPDSGLLPKLTGIENAPQGKRKPLGYSLAQAVAEDQERWASEGPHEVQPGTLLARFEAWCLRHPVVTSLMVVVALILIAATVEAAVGAFRAD